MIFAHYRLTKRKEAEATRRNKTRGKARLLLRITSARTSPANAFRNNFANKSFAEATNQTKPKKDTVMKTKNQKQTNLLIRSSLALALALVVWSPVQAQSAEPADGKKMMDGKMMEGCKEMKAQKQKMKEDMKAQDTELTEHVAKMNSAPEDKKINLMAAVITHMVDQRIAMGARKAKMEEEMMQHMMQHMQMGKESMAQCPMMKGMKGMDDKSGDAHKEHQTEQK
ncbi:hypothetical protein [Chthoniobacter sp.]|uniref:hypothetical protein n=1 Tax=Chthoniobacter sp. TaxID=2510640 RepID=UPI0032AFD516